MQDTITNIIDTVSVLDSSNVDVVTGVTQSSIDTWGLWISLFGGLFSFFGLWVALYTLKKVKSIESAKLEEREVLTQAYNLRGILAKLRLAESSLKLKKKRATASELAEVSHSLTELNSELQTALRIMSPLELDVARLTDVEIIKEGYWSDIFALDAIKSAKSRLIIFTWRCTRCFQEQAIPMYVDALVQNPELEIELFVVSRTAKPEVYQYLDKMLLTGNASSMQNQQTQALEFAISNIQSYAVAKGVDQQVLSRIKIYEYDWPPTHHFVIVDDEVNWGVNFFMDVPSGASTSMDTAYLRAKANSEFGRKVFEQVSIFRRFPNVVQVPFS